MPNPVVHFEVRSADPDAAREFFGSLFDWSFPEGALPGYTYVDANAEGAIPGGIGPTQGGAAMVTFFVGVGDVAETLAEAERLGGKVVQPATSVPGVTFGLLVEPAGPGRGRRRADRRGDAAGGRAAPAYGPPTPHPFPILAVSSPACADPSTIPSDDCAHRSSRSAGRTYRSSTSSRG